MDPMFCYFGLKNCKDYGTNPIYPVLGIFGSTFVFIACLYNIANLLVFGKSKSIVCSRIDNIHMSKTKKGLPCNNFFCNPYILNTTLPDLLFISIKLN